MSGRDALAERAAHDEREIAAALAELARLRDHPEEVAQLDLNERVRAARLQLEVAEQNAPHVPTAEEAAQVARLLALHEERG